MADNNNNNNNDNNETTCRRCGHDSTSKCNLLKHLRRKTPCPPIVQDIDNEEYIKELLRKEYNDKTYDCPHCSAKFNAYQNRHRHMKTCKEAEKHNKDNIIKLLKEQNALLREQLQVQLTPSSQNIVNNITTNNTINIMLHNFGNEDTTHLSHELLSHCLLNPTKGLPKLIDNIHYNPNIPSNHNLRYRSTKNNSLEKFVDEHWIECDTSNTLDELIRKGYRILNTHYTEHFMSNPEFTDNELGQRALERFRFLSDKTCNEYHSVKRDLRLLIKDRTMYIVGLPEPVASVDVPE